MYFWGAQLEVGAFPTSYIPTEAVAVTRNADVATMTGTNFSDWFNATEGAFTVWFDNIGFNTAAIQFVLQSVGSLRSPQTTSGRRFYGQNGGVLGPFGSNIANVLNKFSLAYRTSEVERVSFNGVNVVANSVAYTTAPTALGIGCSSTGTSPLNGHVSKVFYWPQKLTDAELLAFSKG
jgi:hypothetical protein